MFSRIFQSPLKLFITGLVCWPVLSALVSACERADFPLLALYVGTLAASISFACCELAVFAWEPYQRKFTRFVLAFMAWAIVGTVTVRVLMPMLGGVY